MEAGIIHIIAVLFIILGATRIFSHYSIFDPWLERFSHTVIIALLIFAMSHFVEFLTMVVRGEYTDNTFAITANFYMMSIFAIAGGVEILLKKYNKKRNGFYGFLPWIFLALLAFFTITLLFGTLQISLKSDEAPMFLYVIFSLSIGIYGLFMVNKMGKVAPVIKTFTDYVSISILLVLLAVLSNILYEVFEEVLFISEIQIIYISHFTFYFALSVLFLSFKKLDKPGGIFTELQKIKSKK